MERSLGLAHDTVAPLSLGSIGVIMAGVAGTGTPGAGRPSGLLR